MARFTLENNGEHNNHLPVLNKTLRLATFIILSGIKSVLGQDQSLDILQYDLKLKIGFEHKEWWMASSNELEAEAIITVKNDGVEPLRQIPVLLNRLTRATSIKVNGIAQILPSQSLEELKGWETYQVRFFLIDLQEPIRSNREVTLSIIYQGPLTGYEESGMAYVKEKLDPKFTIIRPETLVYPHLCFPMASDVNFTWRGSDSYYQRISITLPDGYIPACGYDLEAVSVENQMKNWIFKSRNPSHQIIIPIAQYEVLEVERNRILYFPEDVHGANRVAVSMKAALNLFKNWFGPMHDSSSFALAEIPEGFGSQAIKPTILQEQSAFGNQESIGELYHELSHFWNVPDPEANSMRWNEGLAMFLQYLATDELDGSSTLYEELENNRLNLKKYYERYPDTREIPFRNFGKEGMTARSYTHGAVFFGLLYHKMSKERFIKILHDFYQHYHTKGATPEVFSEFIISKDNSIEKIINDWFYGTAFVDLVSQLTFTEIMDRYK